MQIINAGGGTVTTLTGDATGSGVGTIAVTIANDAVSYAKMQDVSATARILGRITAGAGDVEELTGTQVTTLLDAFTTVAKGLTPASGGGTTNFLRADGSWAAPPGGGATITLTGDVTGSGTTSIATSIAANAVQNADIRSAAATSVIGRSANSTGDVADIAAANDGEVLKRSGSVLAFGRPVVGLGFDIDGGGSTITTGVKGDLYVPFDCVITAVTLLADTTGSIVIDIWKDTYANYPPTASPDSITASAKPTISSATKSQDNTLTGWTTTVAAGSTLRFNVDSVTTLTRVALMLTANRTS